MEATNSRVAGARVAARKTLNLRLYPESRPLEAIDKLTATVLALMVLFAVVNVTICLILGGHVRRTDISDDHTHDELLALSQRFEPP